VLYLIFFILFITTFPSNRKTNNHALFNVIYFVTGTLVLAELLSLFECFDLFTIRVVIMVLFSSYLVYLYRKGAVIVARSKLNKGLFWVFENKRWAAWGMIVFSAIIISGLMYFPTNHDANVYHLPRFIIWLQQGHLNHFETPVYRMVYQPYLTELVMAFIYATGGPISILTMWSVIMLLLNLWILRKLVALLPRTYRMPREHLLIVMLLCWSILLQATTTLNDIHLMFYLLFFNCFIWKKSLVKEEYVIMILTLFLGYLTKGTFSIYFIANMFLWIVNKLANGTLRENIRGLLILGQLNKTKLLWLLLLLLPTTIRNFTTSRSLLGVTIEEKALYFNDEINIEVGLSNTIKNAVMNAATPFSATNNILYKFTVNLHKILGLPDVNDSGFNWSGMNYELTSGIHLFFYPEVMTNTLLWFMVFFLMVVALIRSLIMREKSAELVYLYITGVSFLFLFVFSMLLRWQPWHSRLLMPVFLIQSYGVVRYIGHFKVKRIFFKVVSIMGLLTLMFNANRPLVPVRFVTTTNFTIMEGSTLVKSKWDKECGYTHINELIGSNKKVGFFMSDSNTPMFHFMYLTRHTQNKFTFCGNFQNPTNRYRQINQMENFDYFIVSVEDIESFQNKVHLKHPKLVFRSNQFMLYKMNSFLG